MKIALIVVGIFVGLRVASALAIYGVRGYLSEAKASEAKVVVGAIARGMVECVKGGGEASPLPPSAPAVPSSVPNGKKYQSRDVEWEQPAFQCAHFKLTTPQYFQYEWELVSPLVGVIHARGDLDGDGRVDAELTEEIRCTAVGVCTPGALVVNNH